jgi:hypothetical protein
MRRREFITLLGGAAAAWPLAVRGQQGGTAVVGYLHSGAAAPFAHLVAVFREALRDSGYIEGQNLAIEYRWANGEYGRLQALATDLVQRQVAVIVTAGGSVSGPAKRGQQFPPSDGDCHTPLLREVIPRHERAVLTAAHPGRAGRASTAATDGPQPRNRCDLFWQRRFIGGHRDGTPRRPRPRRLSWPPLPGRGSGLLLIPAGQRPRCG